MSVLLIPFLCSRGKSKQQIYPIVSCKLRYLDFTYSFFSLVCDLQILLSKTILYKYRWWTLLCKRDLLLYLWKVCVYWQWYILGSFCQTCTWRNNYALGRTNWSIWIWIPSYIQGIEFIGKWFGGDTCVWRSELYCYATPMDFVEFSQMYWDYWTLASHFPVAAYWWRFDKSTLYSWTMALYLVARN